MISEINVLLGILAFLLVVAVIFKAIMKPPWKLLSTNAEEQWSRSATETKIFNDFPQPTEIKDGNSVLAVIEPRSFISIPLENGKMLSSKTLNYDGSPINYSVTINSQTPNLYITHRGIFSDKQAKRGSLWNKSGYPVIFVQYSLGGRRWPYATIGPDSSFDDAIITSRSRWEVVHPAEELNPITHLNLTGDALPDTITFDGETLKV